ncbi:MAG: BrnT family toxin [Saccharofermentans sp.]|nr:BrnT family toxin [Saccharofermentans sp.]
MKELEFEWDNNKAFKNEKKHEGISFEEAKTVFDDEKAILFDDPDHSIDEQRFILIGMSCKPRMLVVCHCYRGEENTIRIISARKATKTEAKQYYEINERW